MPRRDPHNLFLFILTASGFIGGIPAFLGLWFSTADAWKARIGPYTIVPFAMMIVALVGNLSVTWYSKLFWITLAFACAAWASLRLPAPVGPVRSDGDGDY
jgi:O-antigen ligase